MSESAHGVRRVYNSDSRAEAHELAMGAMAGFVEGFHRANDTFNEFDRRFPKNVETDALADE